MLNKTKYDLKEPYNDISKIIGKTIINVIEEQYVVIIFFSDDTKHVIYKFKEEDKTYDKIKKNKLKNNRNQKDKKNINIK